jgi:hypothetical protein
MGWIRNPGSEKKSVSEAFFYSHNELIVYLDVTFRYLEANSNLLINDNFWWFRDTVLLRISYVLKFS